MLRLTLAQMRTSAGRLVAAGIAIALGACFVAVTFLATTVMEQTVSKSLTTGYGNGNLVVDGSTGRDVVTPEAIDAITNVEGVEAVAAVPGQYVSLTTGAGREIWLPIQPLPTSPALSIMPVDPGGSLPQGPNEVAVPLSTAKQLDISIGDELTINGLDADSEFKGLNLTEAEAASLSELSPVTAVVVGILNDRDLSLGAQGNLMVTNDALETISDQLRARDALSIQISCRAAKSGADVNPSQVILNECAQEASAPSPGLTDNLGYLIVKVNDPTELASVQRAISSAVPSLAVKTIDEVASEKAADFTGDSTMIVAIVLGFAAISLFVAGLVITNTFQVIVAQRTRTLALLRCVGATRAQIRRSVLIEAGILGVIASAVGLLVGLALGQATLWILAARDVSRFIPTTISVTPAVIIAPLAIGLAVTLIAALSPARQSTRVAPLAALRPIAVAPGRSGIFRKLAAATLTVIGLAVLGAGIALTRSTGEALSGLAVGILGGVISFIGVLLAAVYYVPGTIRLLAKPFARLGVTARVATQNAVRNPKRTAATSTALIIGVTLVTLMSVGAASAKQTLDNTFTQRYPFDVQVEAHRTSQGMGVIGAQTSDAIAAVPGVAATMPVASDDIDILGLEFDAREAIVGLDPVLARGILNDPTLLDGLEPGKVLVSASSRYAADPTLTMKAARPEASPITLEVAVSAMSVDAVFVMQSDFESLGNRVDANVLWIRTDADADPQETVSGINNAVSDQTMSGGTAAKVAGPVVQRQEVNQVIDTVLIVITGLLAVAVVIALIGVANTLSLSVIERRRESAMLRALGMTKRSLRATLAVEGALIAGIGALLGVGLGIIYGFAGAATVFSAVNVGAAVAYSVPWGQLVAFIAVAVVAGLLASVVPASRAARTPPVAALAED